MLVFSPLGTRMPAGIYPLTWLVVVESNTPALTLAWQDRAPQVRGGVAARAAALSLPWNDRAPLVRGGAASLVPAISLGWNDRATQVRGGAVARPTAQIVMWSDIPPQMRGGTRSTAANYLSVMVPNAAIGTSPIGRYAIAGGMPIKITATLPMQIPWSDVPPQVRGGSRSWPPPTVLPWQDRAPEVAARRRNINFSVNYL